MRRRRRRRHRHSVHFNEPAGEPLYCPPPQDADWDDLTSSANLRKSTIVMNILISQTNLFVEIRIVFCDTPGTPIVLASQ